MPSTRDYDAGKKINGIKDHDVATAIKTIDWQLQEKYVKYGLVATI